MTKEEFQHKYSIEKYGGMYFYPYRKSSIEDYLREKGLFIQKNIIGTDNKLILDGCLIKIFFVGKSIETKENAYMVLGYRGKELIFKELFFGEYFEDNSIEELLNTICRILHENNYKNVEVVYYVIMNEHEFDEYFKTFLQET